MNSIFLAAVSFHGGGLVLTCTSWSLIFGFQTPLQSGSLARSAQSCAVGGGLMTVGALLGASADAIETAATRASGTATKWKNGLNFTGISPANHAAQHVQSSVASTWCLVKSVHREADPAAKRDHSDPCQKRNGRRGLGRDRGRAGFAPARALADADEVKHRHVDAGEREQDQLAAEEEVVRVVHGVRGEH